MPSTIAWRIQSHFASFPMILKETQWKIFAAGLPPFLAQRLAVGR